MAILKDDRQNLIINGGFDFWQRGASITTSARGYTADRFLAFRGGGLGNITVSQQNSDVESSVPNCARIQRPNGDANTGAVDANGAMFFGSVLESVTSRGLRGKKSTLSFSIRKGSGSNSDNMLVKVMSGTGVDEPGQGSSAFTGESVVVNVTESITSVSSSFTRYTYTFDVPSNSNQLQFYVSFSTNGTAGTDDYIEIKEVQLNEGAQAPQDFQRSGRTLAGELQLCQRYYEKSYNVDIDPGSASNDGIITSVLTTNSNRLCGHQFSVTKRVNPSYTVYNRTSGAVNNVNILDNAGLNYNVGFFGVGQTGVGQLNITSGSPSNTQRFAYHFTADSEL